MDYRQLIDEGARTRLHVRRISKQLYFLAPSFVFDGNYGLQLELYERICEFLNLPLACIRLVGSGHTGFSLIHNTPFNRESSDLDVAIVDPKLYLELFELAFDVTNGWSDVSKFPGRGEGQRRSKEQFLKYLRKGVIRPDLMPASPKKADWENFFGLLADDYSKFCNGLSAGVYASELFLAAKQESALTKYLTTQGVL